MVKLVAFHLPQFHPIPENDLWWGRGFTEWTNVTKAAPLFSGHYQPHLPSDLGFYDLRLKQARLAQIALAKQYGIDAFCFHYYWFGGKRLLHEPVDEFISDPDHDMGFCLSWANENWTRRWDAAENEVLISQTYDEASTLALIDNVIPSFRDPRYVKVDGRPFFMVYRPQHLPDARAIVERWRRRCRERGVGEVHLACALIHGNRDYAQYGFDSGVEFPPHNLASSNVNSSICFDEDFVGNAMQFSEVAQSYIDRDYGDGRVFRTVFPSWDNSARTGRRALLMLNGTPDNYEFWLSETISRARARGDSHVFINAWNEWAEGCHLEPDRRYGMKFLEATARAKAGASTLAGFPDSSIPTPAAQKRRRFRPELGELMRYHGRMRFGDFKMWLRTRPRLYQFALRTRAVLAGFGNWAQRLSR